MTAADILALTAEALRLHRLRTILTLVATSVGVIAVLLLTSLGQGARDYVVREFTGMGANIVVIVPGKIETQGGVPPMGGGTRDLTIADAEAIERQCPSVLRAAPVAIGSAVTEYGGRSRTVPVLGTTPAFYTIRNLAISTGRFLPSGDPRRGEAVVVIGRTVQRELFRGDNPLGKAVRVGERRFRVIGVLAPKGSSLAMNMDDVVIIPAASALNLFNQTSLFRILAQARSEVEIEKAERQILDLLADRHDDEDITTVTQGAVLTTFRSILNTLTMSLAGIAAVSLAVAGIGIMNVMLVSVSERTSEVGLLKALGARRRQILAVFLIEALLLAVTGALLGVGIGVAAIYAAAAAFPNFPMRPDAVWIGVVLAMALVAGSIFGLLPARRAASVAAADALRGRIG